MSANSSRTEFDPNFQPLTPLEPFGPFSGLSRAEKGSGMLKPLLDDVPDGGFAAWTVVLGTWTTSFCSFGWINSVGVFQDYYEHNMLKNYSSSAVAWIPSLQIFFIMVMVSLEMLSAFLFFSSKLTSLSGPLIGRLHDKYGPRRLIFVGTILHVFGLMMASLATQYYQILLSQGICSAIGASAIFQPALSTVAAWFSKKRAAAFGICATGSSIGGVIFPIMLSRLIREVGFGWTMRISAFLILFLLIIANLTVRPRLAPKRGAANPANPTAPFREAANALLMGGFFLITFGIFIPIDYIVVEARAAGMGPAILQYLVPILNGASFFGRTLSGLFADKLGRFNVFVIVCMITSLLTLTVWIPAKNNAALISYAGFFGFFSGAYISLAPALVAEISPPEEFGYRSGLLFFCASIGGLVTNPIAGAIFAAENHSFTGLKVFSAIFCLVGAIIVFGARLSRTGPKLAVKF